MANERINVAQLATPDFIKNIPDYYGESGNLLNFINTCNPVAEVISGVDPLIQPFWLTALRNKVKGIASDRLRLYGNPTDWNAIKLILNRHFTDHRDERTLYNQLSTLKQSNNTIIQFYDKILELVTTLNEKVTGNYENLDIRQAMIQRNLNEGLDTFMKGVREPLKTILLSRSPSTLYEAYDVALLTTGEDIGKRLEPYNPHNQNKPIHNPPGNNFVRPPLRPAVNQQFLRNNNHNGGYRQNYVHNGNFNAFRPRPDYHNQSRPEPMDVDPSTQMRRNGAQPPRQPVANQYRNRYSGQNYNRQFNNNGNFNQNQRANATNNNERGQVPIVIEELFNNENFRNSASE